MDMFIHPGIALLLPPGFLGHRVRIRSIMIELTPEQRRALRAAAHPLHPVVSISQNGLSENVIKEIDRSLLAHELIKVKLHGIEREGRAGLLAAICEKANCAPVQQIGNTLVLWRPKPEDNEATPTGRRKAKPMTKKQAAMAQEGKAPSAAKKPPAKAPRRGTAGTTARTPRAARTTRT
jgi:RNA-binding protein